MRDASCFSFSLGDNHASPNHGRNTQHPTPSSMVTIGLNKVPGKSEGYEVRMGMGCGAGKSPCCGGKDPRRGECQGLQEEGSRRKCGGGGGGEDGGRSLGCDL